MIDYLFIVHILRYVYGLLYAVLVNDGLHKIVAQHITW
jgi:hypothetical protein